MTRTSAPPCITPDGSTRRSREYCEALAIDPASRQAEANAYAALGQKIEGEGPDPALLEGLPVAEDGSVEITLPDPCAAPPRGGG